MSFLHGVETIESGEGLRPIATADASVIGLVGDAAGADPAKFPENTPVLVTKAPPSADIGTEGQLAAGLAQIYAQGSARVIVVRVPYSADNPTLQASLVGDQGDATGLWALSKANAIYGLTPRIICVPNFSKVAAVQAEMVALCAKLRSIAVIDSPQGDAGPPDPASAIAHAALGTQRTYHVWPFVRVANPVGAQSTLQPASPAVAGVIARTDTERGFWWSPSNQPVYGVTGPLHPVEWSLNDPSTLANTLNEANVATFIRAPGGLRLWGNRVPSGDSLWAFLPVRRTADMIEESIEDAQLWAMDRPFSANLLVDIRDSVRAYLRQLQARGAILGGNVWLDPELNTAQTLQAGQLYVNYDFEPPAPLERLTFTAYRNGDYYSDLIAQAAAAS